MRIILIACALLVVAACTTAPRGPSAEQGSSRDNPLPSPFEPPAEVDPPPQPAPGEPR